MILNNGHRPGIIKSVRQQLKESLAINAKYEAEAKAGCETIEQLKWQNSRRQITIMALGIHFQLTPEAMQAIVQPFFDKQLDEIKKEVEAIKSDFKANLAAGKMPEFTVVENPDLNKEG